MLNIYRFSANGTMSLTSKPGALLRNSLLGVCIAVAGLCGYAHAGVAVVEDSVEMSSVVVPQGPYALIETCIEAHINAHNGRAASVRKLRCPGQIDDCSEPPDLAALARLPNLTSLDLSQRCIRDVTPITSLIKLRRLELAGNAIEIIRPLGKLKKLNYLGLADNPVIAHWLYNNREPFSELHHLDELVLDGTSIDNILPLAQAKNLQKLSLRRMYYLESLRPLVALPKLRALHIDDVFISDLRPLAQMTRLEELTADRTYVNSVEPLRALVSRYQLRKVSLRETCVTSCDALNGATHDCSEPQPQNQCFVPEVAFTPHMSKFAVPVSQVERFAPPDLPIWSKDELARGFEAARSSPDIDWTDARGNCDLRAITTTSLFQVSGFPAVGQVMSFGNLRMLSSKDPLGFLMFDWHVAVAVHAQDGATTGYFVIDPALDDTKPMRLADWFARQVDSSGSALDFACEPYWGINAGHCPNSLWVDANGKFLVDPLPLVRGSLCRDLACGQ